MTTEYALQVDASNAWEELLVRFTPEGVRGKRDFRLPVELVIATVSGQRWVIRAGTVVHLFCFITGEGATKRSFRIEGSFFLPDRVISISGKYKYVKPKEVAPKRPPKPPAPYTRKVCVTLHSSMRGGYALRDDRALSSLD